MTTKSNGEINQFDLIDDPFGILDSINSIDNENNMMVMDMESELLLNKFICPNGHHLIVKSCSCDPSDIHQKNIILSCEKECEYNNLRSLDCGRTTCEFYNR